MTIKIAGVTFDKYNQAFVNLIYDSIASTFSFLLYFDPNNEGHRKALLPGLYPDVTIEHNGQLLLTGTLLLYRFQSSAVKSLVHIEGYTKTGVLEDCQIPGTVPLQSDGVSLTAIATKICDAFGLTLIVDDTVRDICSGPIPTINADATETVKSYLSAIAGQLNVVISHTPKGELLLTGYKTKVVVSYSVRVPDPIRGEPEFIPTIGTNNRISIATFVNGMPGIEFEQVFDGQKMHSSIAVTGQATFSGTNAVAATPLNNPFVGNLTTVALKDQNDINNAQIYGQVSTIPRPKVINQTTGTYLTTDKAQQNALCDEYKHLPLIIKMRGWELGGKLAMPGDIITITNPDLHIYTPARFFIESIQYNDNPAKETCTIHCVIPETFNNDVPKNIFA